MTCEANPTLFEMHSEVAGRNELFGKRLGHGHRAPEIECGMHETGEDCCCDGIHDRIYRAEVSGIRITEFVEIVRALDTGNSPNRRRNSQRGATRQRVRFVYGSAYRFS